MKKLIFLLSIILVSFTAAKAQTVTVFQSDQTVHKLGLDTASGTTPVSQLLTIKGKARIIVQTAVTKLTGTPGGIVNLFGSVKGVKYSLVSTDTLKVANVAGAQTKAWKVSDNDFVHYKVTYTPTGTQTSTITTDVLIRP